ncbi:FlgD immunoglobulin-like domain containing protein [Treponema denticola]|uniref:FlgD immunoglobulin-like domain containing protein n=1 Tax=Treponema denticola TaxID=158 RepID=UPI0020A45982|nr:FlgD immunoglobulin-like domain containing protein [Treponema denticola]UTC86376.1 hypothetical protein E4N91_12365 [Treponema denticola]
MKKIQKTLFILIFLFAAGILASAQTYTWTGGHGNFKNPLNWSPNLPAGTTPAAFPAGTYKILSPGPCFLTENITFAGPAQIEVGSDTAAAGLQLAHYTLRGTVTVTVNKKGTLELSGTDEHRNLFSGGKITLNTDSTVVYYGNTGKNIWQGPYQNLIVRGPIQAQSLAVNKTMTIARNPPADNPLIQITAPVQTYNGNITVLTNAEFRAATSVTFGRSITATGRNLSFTGGGAVSIREVTAGTVSAAGTSMLTVNGIVNLSGDLKAKKLTVNTATVTAAKIEVSQTATVSTAATITAPTQTYTGKITAKNGSAYKNIIFITGSATGTGLKTKDLTAGNITVNGNWDAGDHDHPVNIEANGDIEVTGNFSSVQSTVEAKKVSGSGGNITVNTANTQWRCWGDITAEGNMIIKDMKASGGTIKILGNLTAGIFHFADYGKLLFSGSGTKTISFTNPSEIRELEIASGTTLNLLSDIKITHKLTNNGTFAAGNHSVTLTKANKIDTLDPDPIPSEIIITGTSAETSTQFKDLDCTDSYIKTLTINGKISVVGDLKLQGQSATSSLTVQGDTGNPHIALTSANSAKGQFLKVKTNIPIRGGTYTAENSIAVGSDTDIQAGKPENWIFTNYNGAVSWTGKKSNAWADHRNWTPYVIPGINTIVTIPVVTTQYPKLTANVKAKTITLAPGAKLDLADYVITKSNLVSDFTPITNNGTLRMKGTSSLTDPKGQKEWLESTVLANQITHGTTSVIEYYSTANNPLWRGPYQNLTVSEGRTSLTPINPGSGSTAADLTVENTFTVAANAGDNFIITANSQLYKQTVSLRKKTTFSSFGGTGTVFKGSVLASGIDIGFSGNGLIKTESTVTAKDIIVNPGINTWTSSGTITAQDITVQRAWTSTGNVTANGYITANDWTAKNVTLKGNLTAVQFNQTGGTLTFNSTGTPEQELNFTGVGDKNIFNLTIDTGAKVKLLSPVTIVRNITNGGTFNADTYTVTLDNNNSHTITGTSYGDNTKKTEFHNLECTGATGKTLTINRKITVENALKLSGGGISNRLIINGTGEISLKTDHSGHTDPSRQFLKIDTRNLKVLEKPYVVNQSVDHTDATKSHNGWIFYKDPATISIKNSFAKPGDEYIYLLFSNTSYMSEEELKFIGKPPYNCKLEITGGSTTYESSLQDVSPANPEKTLWKIKLDKEIKANDILKPSCQVVLDYFGTPKNKAHISDIGINIVKPQKAFNSIVLRTFDANPDDKALPTLDITIPTERESTVTSDNFKLYFISKDAPGRFWHPDTITSPPGSFANPQSGTTEYTGTPAGGLLNFIIPSTDPYLKEGKVGQFMYVYDGWLPCARLKDETGNDILSLDVWNFKIVGIQIQKGGVSIFENVVNPYKGQSATIAAHLKKSGMLTIQIMTLDGNIVRTLTRSHHNAGDHFYLWDGRNNGGNPVASGMYFVRIAGPDIDEVRKILIIK